MNEKIRNHVDTLFYDAPATRRTTEFKEELISNLLDRYNDLVAQGKNEEEAYAVVIAGIGDVDELIRGLREQNVFDPTLAQLQRQKSALLVSFAVGLYIVSFLFPIIFSSSLLFNSRFFTMLGSVLMFLTWAFATGLLIYNAMSKPKYIKSEDTMVEDFKEWKREKPRRKSLERSIQSMVWSVTVIIYLSLGFFLDVWNPGWMIFLLAAVVTQIVHLVFSYMGADR